MLEVVDVAKCRQQMTATVTCWSYSLCVQHDGCDMSLCGSTCISWDLYSLYVCLCTADVVSLEQQLRHTALMSSPVLVSAGVNTGVSSTRRPASAPPCVVPHHPTQQRSHTACRQPVCLYPILLIQGIAWQQSEIFHRWQFDEGILIVQPPSECFWSGARDGFIAAFGGRTASLTSRFDLWQHEVSYLCSVRIIAL